MQGWIRMRIEKSDADGMDGETSGVNEHYHKLTSRMRRIFTYEALALTYCTRSLHYSSTRSQFEKKCCTHVRFHCSSEHIVQISHPPS